MIIVNSCSYCGKTGVVEEIVSDGEDLHLCSDCVTKYGECEDCGSWFFNGEGGHRYNRDTLTLCDVCYQENYFTCLDCGNVINESRIREVHNGDFVCEDCLSRHYSRCFACDDYFPDNDIESAENHTYCNNCYGELFCICINCGVRTTADDIQDDLCPACYEASNQLVHPYSYKPPPKKNFWKNEGADCTLYGIELEVECCWGKISQSEVGTYVRENFGGLFYCKHDASLNLGVEIVSHPFSRLFFENKAKAQYEKLLAWLQEKGCKSYNTNTCGLHVHVSKKSLSPYLLFKMIAFTDLNQSFIFRLSRRKSEGDFHSWAAPKKPKAGCLRQSKNNNDVRYSAINTQPPKTAEFRIFKGTIDFSGFLQRIETVFAIEDFCRTYGGPCLKNRFEFCSFVAKNRKEYFRLYEFLIRKNYLPEDKKKKIAQNSVVPEDLACVSA